MKITIDIPSLQPNYLGPSWESLEWLIKTTIQEETIGRSLVRISKQSPDKTNYRADGTYTIQFATISGLHEGTVTIEGCKAP